MHIYKTNVNLDSGDIALVVVSFTSTGTRHGPIGLLRCHLPTAFVRCLAFPLGPEASGRLFLNHVAA